MKYLLSFPCVYVCLCVASLYFEEMAVRRNDKRTMRTFFWAERVNKDRKNNNSGGSWANVYQYGVLNHR